MPVRTRAGWTGGIVLGLALACAGPAQAHVQVTPAVVAPADPVQFTVLVPGERDTGTVKVDLRLPEGLVPFSFEEPPGWKRRIARADNGEAERVVWTGRSASDGLVRFTFLAGTPEQPTTMQWKSLQTYADGHVSRWIGAPDAEYPAATTEVRAAAERQNAGGEGRGTDFGSAPEADVDVGSASADPDDRRTNAAETSSGGADWLARGLAVVALVIAAGVGFVFGRRRPSAS